MIPKKSHHLPPQPFSPLRPVPILQPAESAGRRKILPFFRPGDKGEKQGAASDVVSRVSASSEPPADLSDRGAIVSLYTLRYKDCPTLVWHDLTWGTVVNFAKSNILLGACEGWLVECPDGERLTFYQVISIEEGGLVS